ncbi:hypothetical protein ACFLZZ_03965 [Nanoarchaeota archaeon]
MVKARYDNEKLAKDYLKVITENFGGEVSPVYGGDTSCPSTYHVIYKRIRDHKVDLKTVYEKKKKLTHIVIKGLSTKTMKILEDILKEKK